MRYKEFNRVRVLEKCMLLFWDNGFRGTAISKIVEVTRVNRFSLYSEFDDKEGILYNSLKHYKAEIADPILQGLKSNSEPEEVLKSVYREFLLDNPNHPSGCFIIHTATELADENEWVQNFLDDYLTSINKLVFDLLSSNGYKDNDATFLAKHLTSLFCTSMCFSLLQSANERINFVENCIALILNQKEQYA